MKSSEEKKNEFKKFVTEELESFDEFRESDMSGYVNDIVDKAVKLFAISEVCSWAIVQDGDDEYYETDCGQTFCVQDGTLKENSHRYCQACGKEIKLTEAKEKQNLK